MMNLKTRCEKDVDENNNKHIKISCYREKIRDNNFAAQAYRVVGVMQTQKLQFCKN